jgi:hypothetical protein
MLYINSAVVVTTLSPETADASLQAGAEFRIQNSEFRSQESALRLRSVTGVRSETGLVSRFQV